MQSFVWAVPYKSVVLLIKIKKESPLMMYIKKEPPCDPSIVPIDAGGTPRRRAEAEAEAEDDYSDDSSSAGASGWSSSAGMSSSSAASTVDASFKSASFDTGMDDILLIPRRSRSRSIESPDNIDRKISAALDAFVTKCQKRIDSNLEWVHLVNAIKEKNRKSNDPLLGKIMSGSGKDNNSNRKTVGQSRACSCNNNKNGQEGQYVVSLSSGGSSSKPPVAAVTEANTAVAQTSRAGEKVKKFLRSMIKR